MAILKTHNVAGTAGQSVDLAASGWDVREGSVNATYRNGGGILLPGSAFNALDDNLSLSTDLYVFASFIIPTLPTGSVAINPLAAVMLDDTQVAQVQFRGTDIRLRNEASAAVATSPFAPVAGAEWCMQWHIGPTTQDIQIWKRATISGAPDWDSGPVDAGDPRPEQLLTGQKTASGFDWALTAMQLATAPFYVPAPPAAFTSRTHGINGVTGQPVQFAAEGWDAHTGAVTALYVDGGPLDLKAMEFSGGFELFDDELNLGAGDDLYVEAIWCVPTTPTDNIIALSAETAGGNLVAQMQIRPADVRVRDQNGAAQATSSVFPAPGSYVRTEWRIGGGTQKLKLWRNAVDFAGSPDYASGDVACGADLPTLLRAGTKLNAASKWRLNRLRLSTAPFTDAPDPSELKDHQHQGTPGTQMASLAAEGYDATVPVGATLPNYVAAPGSVLPSMLRFPTGVALQLVDNLANLHKFASRFYLRIPTATDTANVIVANVQDSTLTVQASIQVRPGVDIRIRNQASTAVDQTSFAPVPGVVYLCEWYVDIDAGTQTLKVWDTTDSEAGTPLDTLTGACGTAVLTSASVGKSTTAATTVDIGPVNVGTTTPRGPSLLAGHQEVGYYFDGTSMHAVIVEGFFDGSQVEHVVRAETPTPPPPPPPPDDGAFPGHQPGHIYYGMSTDGSWATEVAKIGHPLGVERIFQPDFLAKCRAALAAKRIPWISTKPDYFGAPSSAASGWSYIASGNADAAIRTLFRQLVPLDQPICYTFAHEPMGGASNADAAVWAAAWHRIMNVVDADTGRGQVLFAPNMEEFKFRSPGTTNLDAWHPVDLLARFDFYSFDAYQYGDTTAKDAFSVRLPRIFNYISGRGFPNMLFGIGEHGARNVFKQSDPSRDSGAVWYRQSANYIFAHPEKIWIASYFNAVGTNDSSLDQPKMAGDTESILDIYKEKVNSATAVLLP